MHSPATACTNTHTNTVHTSDHTRVLSHSLLSCEKCVSVCVSPSITAQGLTHNATLCKEADPNIQFTNTLLECVCLCVTAALTKASVHRNHHFPFAMSQARSRVGAEVEPRQYVGLKRFHVTQRHNIRDGGTFSLSVDETYCIWRTDVPK